MSFQTIQKSSTPERVAEQIRQRIVSGALRAGERLPAQRDLAEQLGVGRSSLREAINALTALGHLEVRHGSGTFVRREAPLEEGAGRPLGAALEAGTLLELLEARELLECKNAALAAERADKGQLADLRRSIEEAAAAEDYHRFLAADIAFHTLLAETAGNVVLQEMTRLVLERLAQGHGRLHTERLSAVYRRKSILSARQVVGAVARGEGPGAAQAMAVHLRLIRAELRRII